MEKSLALERQYTLDLAGCRQYLIDKIEIFLCCLVFINIFFQLFPYHLGVLRIFIYFPTISFVLYILCQVFGFEKFVLNRTYLFLYFLFSCWLLYALFIYCVHPNYEKGMTTLHGRLMLFFVFYIVTQFLSNEKRIRAFEYMVIICLVWNIGVCFWELITFEHLPGSKYYGVFTYIPTGPYRNENDLPSAILVCTPILLFMRQRGLKHICATLLLLIFFIMGTQGARLLMIALFPFLLYHFIRKTNFLYKIVTITAIVLVTIWVFNNIPGVQFWVNKHIKSQVMSFGNEQKSQKIGSTKSRMRVYIMGVEKFIHSKGLGVGVANFQKSDPPYRMYELDMSPIYPHNLFIEILANEGVVGFSILCLQFFLILLPILRNRDRPSVLSILNIRKINQDERRILTFLFFFIVSSSVPASSVGTHIYWNLLGYNYALQYIKSRKNNESDKAVLINQGM